LIRKFFPLDKNYLLEQSQVELQPTLLTEMIETVKGHYQIQNNPLGIEDDFSLKIASYKALDLNELNSFYQLLAGVYRFKYGDSQLEFLWDGTDHSEKYKQDWSTTFKLWINELCAQEQFMQAVFDLTVFRTKTDQPQLAESRMNFVMLNFFELKVHKNKGLVQMKVA
jgi:hypothetical protein